MLSIVFENSIPLIVSHNISMKGPVMRPHIGILTSLDT